MKLYHWQAANRGRARSYDLSIGPKAYAVDVALAEVNRISNWKTEASNIRTSFVIPNFDFSNL